MVHAMANYLGVCSISVGKNKTRRVIVYPRHLFPKVTVKEQERVQKEREKIRDKFKGQTMPGIPRDKPITMREKLIREVYYEKLGKPDDSREVLWDGPLEPRLSDLKHKMHTYEQNLAKKRDRYLKDQSRL